jgi:hypothetical protein
MVRVDIAASSLVRLELHKCFISIGNLDNMFSNSTDSLEHLGLYYTWAFDWCMEPCHGSPSHSVTMFLRKCTRLRSLALCSECWRNLDEHVFLQVQELLQACPNLRALNFDMGNYPDLGWLPNTIETLQITASNRFTAAHWLSFLEERGDALALREISINFSTYEPIRNSSYWWHNVDELRGVFKRRGIRVSGGITERPPSQLE